MTRTRALLIAAAGVLAGAWMILPAGGQGTPGGATLEVRPDPENVVANHLPGRWVGDTQITGRLTGKPMRESADDAAVTFRADAGVLEQIPQTHARKLAGQRIYLAGWMQIEGKPAQPFVLLSRHGNPHVVYFFPIEDQPMAGVEGFNLMLAGGHEPAADLMFMGGKSAEEAFIAFRRQPRNVPTSQPEELAER